MKLATEKKPKFANAALDLATIYTAQNNDREAAKEWETALQLAPNNIGAMINLGNLDARAGK